jgi:16S rRNA (uracil1498-N3)-methyltransferase
LEALIDAPVYLAVGPEGGLADDEVAVAAAAGWRLVDLGPRILRVETAAVLLAAMVAVARRVK